MSSSGSPSGLHWIISLALDLAELSLVLAILSGSLLLIGKRRAFWAVRGLAFVLLGASLVSELADRAGFDRLQFLLEALAVGATVGAAIGFQAEIRAFFEQIGRGDWQVLFRPRIQPLPAAERVIDEIVDAARELSKNRTGALILIETGSPIEPVLFSEPGVALDAEVSRELLQTIFQTSTLLHDGAVLIRGARIVAAGTILPISESPAPRQLGTRHRAAMGISERVADCVCVVVSEETGSISLAERGSLNRPLTRTKLQELLQLRIAPAIERETGTPPLEQIGRQIGRQGQSLLRRARKLLAWGAAPTREKECKPQQLAEGDPTTSPEKKRTL
ncbi:MAG: diadenylate cyclase CdaA [Cyanobacteria bacterium J06641_5]